ncbi:hypothetical protein Ddc_21363 [Ditylenchus destructor]|nr:hypothetical protein Ddc_21363 [Ditylenchus destructor]
MHCHLPKGVVVGFVQKFINLKNCDESQIVHSIRCPVSQPTAKTLKSNYEKFFVKEEKDQYGRTAAYIYEFVNGDIGKKLQLSITDYAKRQVILEIINL